MTRTEALAIVAKEHPCPHAAWETEGTSDWAKCADCGETFRKDGLARRKAASEKFQEALDLLAADPHPTQPGANVQTPQDRLFLDLAGATGSEYDIQHGAVRRVDWESGNEDGTFFKRVGRAVLVYNDRRSGSLIAGALKEGATFGMGDENTTRDDCLRTLETSTNLNILSAPSEVWDGLRYERNQVRYGDTLQKIRTAMRASKKA